MTEAALARWRARVDAALDAALPDPARAPQRLHAAMRHGVLNGGKRMRPLLVYATGSALDASDAALDAAAVAVELIHCYSLIHDDLPAMDDDALRRGQPTVHVAFDEATAILAGDALQALAFEQLTAAPQAADVRIAMLAELARAAGVAGMCGGQALDIDATASRPPPAPMPPGAPPRAEETRLRASCLSLEYVERLHALKTGALLRCAVRLGALAGQATPAQAAALDAYAEALGLAFQIRDDLLDIEGDAATLGKTAGKDQAQDKATFPALLGRTASHARLQALSTQMQAALEALAIDTEALARLARQVVERQH
ncbi:polyprenyl synthetase family protein [Thermomonas sp. S9]|uniref:polyprenyl synthetase family protein n=1 Tax=Thermomonas sp. S9 TaxID=2885203 RepID=UPI00216B17FD|nr:polyprenyl synthetase family protein [Thermomonas sp. S9]MCR6495733.1 polyprenyl synthetase family protein [Thermomonas sp. S9]